MVDTRTRRLTREKLARIVGNNHEAIKLLEDLVADVIEVLPATIDDAAALATLPSDASRASSSTALALAVEQQVLLETLRTERAAMNRLRQELENTLALTFQSLRSQATTIAQLRKDLDELRAVVLGA